MPEGEHEISQLPPLGDGRVVVGPEVRGLAAHAPCPLAAEQRLLLLARDGFGVVGEEGQPARGVDLPEPVRRQTDEVIEMTFHGAHSTARRIRLRTSL